jgi:putative nucleotidyltransferase with HDIG domain
LTATPGKNDSSAELLERARDAERSGEWDLALDRYESALTLAARRGDAAACADVLRWIGSVHRMRGDLELAEEIYEASRASAELNVLLPQLAAAYIGLATVAQLRGQLDPAHDLYRRAREIYEETGDLRLAAFADLNLGTLANIRGDLATALSLYHSALERYRQVGDEPMTLSALTNLGMVRVDLGELDLAEESFDEALALADHLQDAVLLGLVEINRTELYLARYDFSRARECCDQAFEIFGRLGRDAGLAEAYKLYGVLYRETGKGVLADAHFSSAVELAAQSQDRLLEAEALSEWALLHLAEERNREALRCLNQAHHLFAELSARRELLDLDRRLDSLEGTYLQVVRAWGESIESKDRYTAGHCERVANYACMLAQAVGITGRDLTWLRMGGYLHDVGKIAVPEEVLNKPGKLTDEEFKLIQSHAAEGDAIVSELNFPWDIRPAVRWHHERWDGSGYPDGLKGEEIPLTARILCVADVYDALTTTRSYRPAMSREQALEIMERDVGRFFDPALFPVFKDLITRAAPMPDRRFPAFGAAWVVAA